MGRVIKWIQEKKKKVLIINQHFSTDGIKKSLENLLTVLFFKDTNDEPKYCPYCNKGRSCFL